MAFSHTTSRRKVSYLARLTAVALALFPAVSHAQTQPPLPVQDMAFARVGSNLYIQGGYVASNNTQTATSSQFFALDLTTSWSVNSPPWKALSNGIPSRSIYGLGSPDNQTFSTIKVVLPTTYTMSTFNLEQNSWKNLDLSNNDTLKYGLHPVMDPTTGLIYIPGVANMNVFDMKTSTWTPAPIPAGQLTQKYFGGAVYNAARKSIMYLGGYNYAAPDQFEPQTYITEYSISSKSWGLFSTTGPLPSPRADTCMAISEDSKTIVIFGGRTGHAVPKFTGSIHILDMNSKVWRQGPEQNPRTYTACIVIGNMFIAWGGSSGLDTVSGTPLVYDLTLNQWVTSYTAPAYYLNAPKPSSGGGSPSTGSGGTTGPNSNNPSSESDTKSPLGAILGAAFGAALIGALVAALFFIRKRKIERAKSDELAQRNMIRAAEFTHLNNDRSNDNNRGNMTTTTTTTASTPMHIMPPEYTTDNIIPPPSQTPKLQNSKSDSPYSVPNSAPYSPYSTSTSYSDASTPTRSGPQEYASPTKSGPQDYTTPTKSGPQDYTTSAAASPILRNPQGEYPIIYHEQESAIRSNNPQMYTTTRSPQDSGNVY